MISPPQNLHGSQTGETVEFEHCVGSTRELYKDAYLSYLNYLLPLLYKDYRMRTKHPKAKGKEALTKKELIGPSPSDSPPL